MNDVFDKLTEIVCPECGQYFLCREGHVYTCANDKCQFAHIAVSDDEMRKYADNYTDRHVSESEVDYHAKQDYGKPRLSLVPVKIIFAIEMIRAYCNAKYPDGGIDNWKTVESDRHYEASLRHTAKAWNDPFAIDPESGLPHYFHKLCDDAFFVEQNWDKFMEAIEKHRKGVKND